MGFLFIDAAYGRPVDVSVADCWHFIAQCTQIYRSAIVKNRAFCYANAFDWLGKNVSVVAVILGVLIFGFGVMMIVGSIKLGNGKVIEGGAEVRGGFPILSRASRLAAQEGVNREADSTPDSAQADAHLVQHIDKGLKDKIVITLDNVAADANTPPQTQPMHNGADADGSSATTNATLHHAKHAPDSDILPTQTRFYAEPKNAADLDLVLPDYFDHAQAEKLRDNEALIGRKETITLFIRPSDHFLSIDGTTVLQVVRNYALKYGIGNFFHRYENPEGTGVLWFSMLGIGDDGLRVFDLVTLPEQTFRGLALFLSLPHKQALHGFDSMVQSARIIAQDLGAVITDEAGNVITDEALQSLRATIDDAR